ncbi:peptidoglycan-binding protein [Streptomyces sp. NBC_00083]|uniref:peptidoglycan-binding protein n=1 Tax=Streptomyces sp. NBC_00083 TaxID=2975647 RepID=UPI002252C624|nr:peptidoglycan-binding protein [Streptomyces sp. NBC_00083]MCX5382254.1 peptidoglycan-binding protein [Streptomyces sp. NBC_00083]
MEASTPGPVFEDYEPTAECGCAGCADGRRLRLLPVRDGGHPAANGGARRALVAATAASMVLGAGTVAAAAPVPASDGPGANRAADPGPPTEQGSTSGLHGAPGHAAHGPEKPRPTTRAEIINRAKTWVAATVPYDMETYWTDGYRQDCSGYVSMAWDLGTNEWTGSLAEYGVRVTKDELQPGDMLLFHNPGNPTKGSHVVIFGGWTDYTHSYYTAYEQTPPGTRKQATPYAYWKNSANYLPYRYKGLTAGSSGAVPAVDHTADTGAGSGSTAFPGADKFGPGADNSYVTRLGQMLVARGAGRFYTQGPGPRWGTADLNATRAFQQAQGWTGADADGIPGARTWALLVQGTGKNIPPAAPAPAGAVPAVAPTGGAQAARPAYPGPSLFRTGQSGPYVTRLGRQLVLKGFGSYYTSGPGPRWGEADRRNVEAFQRAQGWRGAEADGYPGPETWRRLFA